MFAIARSAEINNKLPLYKAEVSLFVGSGEGTRTPDTAGMNRML